MKSLPREYRVEEVVEVIDGDTVKVVLFASFEFPVDFGFYVKDTVQLRKTARVSLRLMGINTPEMKGPTPEKARASKTALEALLQKGIIRAVTYKDDKYAGRFLARLFVLGSDGLEFSVNDEMIASGFAKPYDGGKKGLDE